MQRAAILIRLFCQRQSGLSHCEDMCVNKHLQTLNIACNAGALQNAHVVASQAWCFLRDPRNTLGLWVLIRDSEGAP